MAQLFDGYAGAGAYELTSGATEFGQFWRPTAGGTVTALRWYRVATGALRAPTVLRLWDTTTQTAVATASSIPDDGSVGWQTYNLPAAFDVVPGHGYAVSAYWPSGSHYCEASVGSLPSPDPGIAWQSPRCVLAPNGAPGYPNSFSTNTVNQLVDVTFAPASTPPDPGATPVDVGNQLADWLISTGDNTHQGDGLPWLTKLVADAISGVVGSTPGQLDATKAVSDAIHDLLTSSNKNLGTLWDLAGHLTDLELAAYKALFGSGAARLTGTNSAGGSAFYTADGSLVSQLVAEIWQRVRVLRGDIGFGTDGWTMTAEGDFEDAIAFAEPADAYALHVTSYQPTQAANTSPAGLWLPRIGWWCVLTGSFASQRAFVDFERQLLSDQGRRMPGCAIQLKPGTLATVQAWVLV